MTSEFPLKQHDTSPSLQTTLEDDQDQAINVSGATVRFHLQAIDGTTVVDAAASVVNDGTDGVVEYEWEDGDTDTPGVFLGEFEVTYSDSSVETFPNSDYIYVEITPDLS